MIVAHAEQAFPTADSHGKNAFQFVVLFFVRPIHQSRHQAETAGVINSGTRAGLDKRARDWIHFHKAGIGEPFLRGERIRGERRAQSSEAELVARVKEAVCARRSLELDNGGRRREQRVNRGQTVFGQEFISERRPRRRGRRGRRFSSSDFCGNWRRIGQGSYQRMGRNGSCA